MDFIKDSDLVISEIKNDNHTEFIIKVNPTDWLDMVFNALPANALIDKGRCGIGGTDLEIRAQRNSIFIVPTNPVIFSKTIGLDGELKNGFFGVYGTYNEEKYKELREFLSDKEISDKKIFVTPESFGKIIKIGKRIEGFYDDWFVLLDESHTVVTESYRKRIIEVFKHFFKFKNKSTISATPYRFSSPKFLRFDRYNITFSDYVGTVTIRHTNYVMADLKQLIVKGLADNVRYHIFLNSVKQISKVIEDTDINNYSIFCKDDKDNRVSLDVHRSYLKEYPHERFLSKFNFYTSKYFEGWDLKDEGAILVIVSDVKQLTLKSGISNKCVQAAGRNRKLSSQVIHITNDYNKYDKLSFDEMTDKERRAAHSAVTAFQTQVIESREQEFVIRNEFIDSVEMYADIDKNDKSATLNDFKVDQIVNRDFTNQEYHNIDHIIEAWQNAYYRTIVREGSKIPLSFTDPKLSRCKRIKIVCDWLEQDEVDYETVQEKLPIEISKIVNYYRVLGGYTIDKLNYNEKMVREAYIDKTNELAMDELAIYFIDRYGNDFISNKELKQILQDLYVRFNILNPKKGKATYQTASASDVKVIFPNAKKTIKNKEHGYIVK